MRQCSRSRKLVILDWSSSVTVAMIIFGARDIVPVVCSIVLSKSSEPFMRDLARAAT